MPAGKVNYLILYEHDAQVYGAASKDVVMSTPPPDGFNIEDKRVYFVTVEPDTGSLVWFRIPQDEVNNAELKEHKKKKKDNNE